MFVVLHNNVKQFILLSTYYITSTALNTDPMVLSLNWLIQVQGKHVLCTLHDHSKQHGLINTYISWSRDWAGGGVFRKYQKANRTKNQLQHTAQSSMNELESRARRLCAKPDKTHVAWIAWILSPLDLWTLPDRCDIFRENCYSLCARRHTVSVQISNCFGPVQSLSYASGAKNRDYEANLSTRRRYLVCAMDVMGAIW